MNLQVKQLWWRILPVMVLVLLSWIPQISAQSSDVITLNDSQSEYPLGRQLEIFEDQDGVLTIGDIVTNIDQSQFQQSQEEVPSFGYTNSVIWARFQIINQSSSHQVWYLDIDRTIMSFIDLYLVSSDGSYERLESGDLRPFTVRDLPYNRFVFPLNVAEDNTVHTVYVRFQSDDSISIPMTIRSLTAFSHLRQTEMFTLGAFLGLLFIMACYNLFLFFSLWDISYLHLVLFILGFLFLVVSTNGFASQFLWPTKAGWGRVSNVLATEFTTASALFFTMTFLNTRQKEPRIHLLMWGIQIAALILTIGVLLAENDTFFQSGLSIIQIVTMLTVLLTGVLMWIKKDQAARFFMVSVIVTLFSVIILASARLGINLISEVLIQNSVRIGFSMLVLMLSLAQANKLNILKEEKASAQAQKESAEAANQAKSQFLSNMSHELRTPLNTVLGFAQVMKRSPTLSPEQDEHLSLIQQSGEYLLSLINQVLDLSKIESGRASIDHKNFDLYLLLNSVEEMFAFQAREKGLHLNFELENSLPQFVCSDEIKLRQILINLLSNAFKFTERGGITVTVGTKKSEESEDKQGVKPSKMESSLCTLHFSVKDTGFGIAPEEMEKLFEAFVQTESGLQIEEGTGLGLPISRQFVQLLGGEIEVTSQLGYGTTFAFDVQVELIKEDDINAEMPIRPVIGMEANQPEYRILAVDNKEINRQLLIELLNPLGFQVREAENGMEAVEVWQEWEPHLIWMDLRMPIQDGYAATQQIKATDQGQSTVVVALSASILEEEQHLALQAGCDDFLLKPFKDSDIFDMMQKHLGVRYIYSEERPNKDSSRNNTLSTITPDALTALPAELLSKLREAAVVLDVELVEQLIDEVHMHNPKLADVFNELAYEFEYMKIADLVHVAPVK